jgi:hypothetical protein
MTNEEYEITYKVYKIVKVGEVGEFETAFGLVYIKSFQEEAEAEQFVMYENDNPRDHTILKVIKRK